MSLDTTLSFIQKMTQGVQGNEADDVALQLLQKMQQSFEELYRADRKIAAILTKIQAGTATHMDTQAYAARVGDLVSTVKNTMQSFVDDFVRNNADQLRKMGMRPQITRRVVGSCCEWCAALAETYDYGTEPKPDFYRRHDHCRCAVIYDPGTGKVQDVHSRKWYTAGNDLLEKRKAVNAGGLPQQLAEHPARLKSFTPESLMEALKRDGYEVKPLGRGAIRNVSFGDGGGYRVNFPDGGILQYHPEKHSHHNGAYYKISTGRKGTHHYGLDGKEIN